ncbi:interleukin-23 receptor isoform X1 [Epinephelus fuscoguttatus]|uniref:interleukin-23 receptor isoform X1 n=1 Tax=Epinephelus fuscoguttatus TaxID=293821 RepID=UPI0020D010ED|nr:interleukin-23 receptor isoform X1 [Epinephelus fuscoguttatus]XP_049444203.1 interleukin-23 receptor isoform X1 [Epinephelus fuscoguttatus]
MNLPSHPWRFVIILLCFSIECFPLLPAGCQHLNVHGHVTVEPAPPFLLGSNLTVYCHVTDIVSCHRSFKIYLELNDETVNSWERVSCTSMIFNLFNVWKPRSKVICKLKTDQLPKIVDGKDLHGGLPPDKPENITCETSRSSDFIDCSWERGQETYLPTTYNISVYRENGTQILSDQIQDAGEITIQRAAIDVNTTYHLNITAYNHLGASRSDPFVLCVKYIVIPESPRIVQVEFGNNSAAVLQWETADSSEHLTSDVRLRTDKGSWEVGAGTELSGGLIRVDGLRPLTEYEFQMRTCHSPSGRTNTPRLTSGKRLSCSKWSPSIKGTSPGKGPSQQLHVWRMLDSPETNQQPEVTVLWKPPPLEDYSGALHQYKIFLGNDHKQEVTCRAALSQFSLPLPAEVWALSISAVTSYGSSPPAEVPLRHSGDSGPVLRQLAPAPADRAVFVSWSWRGNKHWSTSGDLLLYYVLEWTSVPAAALQWKQVAKDQNSASITGLTAGVRYNICLYAVTSRGVSAPSSRLVYSEEKKPVSGPSLSVLAHEARQIHIRWDELPVDKRRGFITNYTIYLQTLDSSNTKLSVTVSANGPRQMWLDCPEGALAVQLTASTSAGEGQPGNRVCSQPDTPAVGLVIVTVIVLALFVAIIANLMCWSCVRERIKQTCISCGPACLDEKLPKPGNSNAIRLLEQYRSELSFSSTDSDPPLSPISLVSQEERDEIYPNIHVEISQVESGQSTAEAPLLTSHLQTMLVDGQLEHVSYKPQIATVLPQGEEVKEAEEEQRDVPTSGEEDGCVFSGFLGDFLSTVEVDCTGPPVGLTLSSVGDLLWTKTPGTTSFLNGGLLVGARETENNVEADSPSLDLQQGEVMTTDTEDTCLSQYTADTILTGGYFPQVAAVSDTELCDT